MNEILAFLSGGLTVAVFNHFMSIRKEIEQHQRERKEEQYKKFLENLLGFFDGWADKKERQRNFLEELYTHAPLYASTEVIRLAGQYVESFSDAKLTSPTRDQLANKLIIAIRREMKVDKKNPLDENDLKRYKLD